MKDLELVKKYINKQCSIQEIEQVDEIISKNKGNKIFNELLEAYWEESDDQLVNSDRRDEMYHELEAIIDSEELNSTLKFRRGMNFLKYAASIAVIVTLTYSGYHYSNTKFFNEEAVAQVNYITKTTSNGQKSTIMLKDGSKIILNSASSIKYPEFFTDSSRTIELMGEAFFEVAVDKKRPFKVSSGDIITMALGTSFNINTKNIDYTKVSLATGKVMISHQDSEKMQAVETYFLEPGEALSVNKIDAMAYKDSFNADEDLLWKDGILYFKNYSFSQIISKIEPWYDVKIDIQNEALASKKYTGKFDNVSLEKLLKNIGFTLGFDFFINDKDVKIIFNNK